MLQVFLYTHSEAAAGRAEKKGEGRGFLLPYKNAPRKKCEFGARGKWKKAAVVWCNGSYDPCFCHFLPTISKLCYEK